MSNLNRRPSFCYSVITQWLYTSYNGYATGKIIPFHVTGNNTRVQREWQNSTDKLRVMSQSETVLCVSRPSLVFQLRRNQSHNNGVPVPGLPLLP